MCCLTLFDVNSESSYLDDLQNAPAQINKQHGASLSWRKLGYDYGWRLAMILSGWAKLPSGAQPAVESEHEAVREMVAKTAWSRLPQ